MFISYVLSCQVQDDNDNTVHVLSGAEPLSESSVVKVEKTQFDVLKNQSSNTVMNQSADSNSDTGNQTFDITEIQELIRHVQWLQLQLKQVSISSLCPQL